jgi:hypothetical protein
MKGGGEGKEEKRRRGADGDDTHPVDSCPEAKSGERPGCCGARAERRKEMGRPKLDVVR